MLGNNIFRNAIRSVITRRCPYRQYVFIVYFHNLCTCHISRFDFCIITNHVFHDSIKRFKRQSLYRTLSYTIGILFYANKDITSAKVLKIIGKRTYRVVNVRRIPATLELYPV